MLSILKDGFINPSFPEQNKYYISFTRDKNFLIRNYNMINGYINCRIVFDGDIISNKYKIEPYDYFAHIKLKKLNTSKRGTVDYNDEQEERLYLKYHNSKFEIKKSLLRIELIGKNIDYIFINKD
jgi:hypothetical protein